MGGKVSKVYLVILIISLVILPLGFVVWIFMIDASADPSMQSLPVKDGYLPTSFWWASAIAIFLLLFAIKNARKSK